MKSTVIKKMLYQKLLTTPLGTLSLRSDEHSLKYIGFQKQENCTNGDALPLLKETSKQLDAYFERKLQQFDLPLDPEGTPFQKKVWHHLQTIPFGKTQTYGLIAHLLETAPRAVGGACGKNKIMIIIPCHRVLGQNKDLGGFSSPQGLSDKRFLLKLEGLQNAFA